MSLGSPVLLSGMTLVSRRPSPSLVKIPGIYGPIPILLDVTLEIYRPGSYQLGMTQDQDRSHRCGRSQC